MTPATAFSCAPSAGAPLSPPPARAGGAPSSGRGRARHRLVLVRQTARDHLVRESARALDEKLLGVERLAVAPGETHARVEAPVALGPEQKLAQNLPRLPPLKPLQPRRAEQARADA